MSTMNQRVRSEGIRKYRRNRVKWLEGSPQKSGVVERVEILSPRKPNSARRKVCRIKLSNGGRIRGYIMGEGHSVEGYAKVLVRGGRVKDLTGVRYKIVRGARDMAGVVNRRTSRSKYGVSKG